MTSVDDALNLMLSLAGTLGEEKVPLLEAYDRILAGDIASEIDIPSFNNSAMDGYAVMSGDTLNASGDRPVELRVLSEIQAGIYREGPELVSGTAICIMTGAVIPGGADGVIPVEDTKEGEGTVKIFKPVKKDDNIRFIGEDISAGSDVLHKGDIVKSSETGLLASLNHGEISVYKRPRIGILSTGDEIVDVGEAMARGQVRNSNAYTLQSLVRGMNVVPEYLGIAEDTIDGLRQKLKSGFDTKDIVITTGGVSLGKYDFIKDVIQELGVDIKIETISMKPGKPLVFGIKGDKVFFGLPGNPVSTMVAFMQFVRPVILKMMGAAKLRKPVVKAILMEKIKKKPGRRHFIRGRFIIKDGRFHVTTTGPQGSGILSSMSGANCIIILPEDIEKALPGDEVMVQLIQHGEV